MPENDLQEFFTEAANKQRLLQCFWTIAQVRYITFKQLKTVKKPWAQHIATRPRLKHLSDLGYLEPTPRGAYTITPKAFDFLDRNGYNTSYLQKRTRGQGNDHDLKITDYILSLQEDPNFFTVFYPVFNKPPNYDSEKLLEPDACIIYQRQDAYKIVFLEVETEKAGWEQHLLDKQIKYQQLAHDHNTYERWWAFQAKKIGLPICTPQNFCFSILCLGSRNYDWPGWTFRSDL